VLCSLTLATVAAETNVDKVNRQLCVFLHSTTYASRKEHEKVNYREVVCVFCIINASNFTSRTEHKHVNYRGDAARLQLKHERRKSNKTKSNQKQVQTLASLSAVAMLRVSN
jgi:hypothetical protein